MKRFFVFLIAVSVAAVSTGCRMCGSPYDYCMPAYTQRPDDYRGCDPLYRAGSIFYGNRDYREGFPSEDCLDCSMGNTGNFGKTQAVPGPRFLFPPKKRRTADPPLMGIPEKEPVSNGNGASSTGTTQTTDDQIPTIDELLDKNRRDSPFGAPIPMPTPMTPDAPAIPIVPPQTQPLRAPVQPPLTMQSGGPSISLDELRQLDPSITDVKILNIDDTPDSSLPDDTDWRQ